MGDKILVVGDANIDIIIHDLAAIPEMGKEVFTNHMSFLVGGGAANVAMGLARLGVKSSLFANLSCDRNGQYLREVMVENGVDLGMSCDSCTDTGISVSVSNGTDRWFISSMGTNAGLNPLTLTVSQLAEYRIIHLSLFHVEMLLEPYIELACRAAKAGCKVSLDINWTDHGVSNEEIMKLLSVSHIFFPNFSEARMLFPGISSMNCLGKKLLNYVKEVVVITNGSKGSVAYTKSGSFFELYPVKAVDAVGTGDAFAAGFLCAYMSGALIQECVSYGCACGSIVATRIGGGNTVPLLDEVKEFIRIQKEKVKISL